MIKIYEQALKQHLSAPAPEILIILGSGLGKLTAKMENQEIIDYQTLGFPKINIAGHAGRLVVGSLGGKKVVCMDGRYHLYEGHNPQIIKDIICAFARTGIKRLIVTNAAGSLTPDIPAGSLVLLRDHINFSGCNPLVGVNDDTDGPRFPAVDRIYDLTARNQIKQIAARKNINLTEGVYLMVLGPNFETPAEVRAFHLWGADIVGMSTVPEVIASAYAGLPVLGISVVTNMAAGLQTTSQSHAETLDMAQKASDTLADLLCTYLEEC